ncbi:MAG: hypothetical protein ACOVP1_01860 [Bacteroidia bacterium]
MDQKTNKLLDLDTLIWYLEGNPKLPVKIKNLIENDEGFNYVCSTSIWELSLRIQKNEIEIHFPLRVFETILFQNHFFILQPGINEFESISQLPGDPSDIFNRMLIALAINKNLKLITTNKLDSFVGLNRETWEPN